ncbi:hypothetical protein ACP70R_041736 [Stipagrostis hirtigluma subsp. patula]
MRRRVLAWLLVAVVFLVCSSRCLAAGDEARKLTAAAAAGGVGTTAGRGAVGGKKPVWNRNRRSLGTRATFPSPPQSNKMRAAAVPAPPPPRM